MLLLEYQGKERLAQAGVRIPKGKLVDNSYRFKTDIILKIQVPSGKRKKRGGVIVARSQAAYDQALTKLQSLTVDGALPSAILAEELIAYKVEHYFSLLVDRALGEVVVLARINGGVDVEDMQDSIFTKQVSVDNITDVAAELCIFYGYDGSLQEAFAQFLHAAYSAMVANDALLVEINPLVVSCGTPVALDCKMEIDDNALFRHPAFVQSERDTNFVMLDKEGNTAIVANGAGLAMATVDQVSQAGYRVTNFLDIGGGANASVITAQFKRLACLPNLSAIIVNIFAGITRCDQVAEAILAARKEIVDLPPLYIRLHGTNYAEAKDLLDKAGIGMYGSLTECIQAVRHD